MEKIPFALSKNGMEIFWDPETSHASTHFKDSPGLEGEVKQLLQDLSVVNDGIRTEVDTGKVVGESSLIETSENDEIVYALRPHRTVYSRFVKGKKPVPTSRITVDVKRDDKGRYYLYTAYVGSLTPSFPGGDYLPEQSKEFWSHHALVWGTQEVIPESVTSECPW